MSDVEQNKQAVVDFLQASFVDGEPEQAVARHVGDRYIQHNPLVPDGAEPFVGFVHWLRGQHPELQFEIKHVVADGDLVVTHSHMSGSPSELGQAVADVFRVENGKLVEHWDVIQEVPAESRNDNGMF
jgi:predicted SnoaL-like aldol condensation-catalyzing enzyme